jgi:hypothetical protein
MKVMRMRSIVLVVCLAAAAVTACATEGADEVVAQESSEIVYTGLPAAKWWSGERPPLPASGRFIAVVGRRNVTPYAGIGPMFVAYGVHANTDIIWWQYVGWDSQREAFLGEYKAAAASVGPNLSAGSANAGTQPIPKGPPPPPGDEWRVANWVKNVAQSVDVALQTPY